MIFTDRKITIRNGKSSIDAPVILYRGDYEVSIKFTIMESKFRFKSGVNLVDSEKASHGQLAILTPYGGNVFSEIVKCEDGTVTFTLTKEMIDQLEEVGLYSFQIRLFDYYRESRVSIPPVEFGIEVREPVASEDHDNEVNNAIVGYSIAKVVDGLNEDVPNTFDDNGNYNKTEWETGDRISQGKLNKIEDAIDKLNQNEKADVATLDKRITSNYNVLDSRITSKYNVLDSRMDIFTSLADGSTTGDAELADIRVDINGNIHSCAGGAVRYQMESIHEPSNALFNIIADTVWDITEFDEIISGIVYNIKSGVNGDVLVQGQSYKMVVSPGEVLSISSTVFGNDRYGLAIFYDNNHKIIEVIEQNIAQIETAYTDYIVTVPSRACLMIISCPSNSRAEVKKERISFTKFEKQQQLEVEVTDMLTTISSQIKQYDAFKDGTVYMIPNSTSTALAHCDTFEYNVSEGEKYFVTSKILPHTAYGLVQYYDSNGNYVNCDKRSEGAELSVIDYEIEIPSTVTLMRICVKNGTLPVVKKQVHEIVDVVDKLEDVNDEISIIKSALYKTDITTIQQDSIEPSLIYNKKENVPIPFKGYSTVNYVIEEGKTYKLSTWVIANDNYAAAIFYDRNMVNLGYVLSYNEAQTTYVTDVMITAPENAVLMKCCTNDTTTTLLCEVNTYMPESIYSDDTEDPILYPMSYAIDNDSISIAYKMGDSQDFVVNLRKKGGNNIFDFYSEGVIENNSPVVSSDPRIANVIATHNTDWHCPYIVRAVNNADGDNINKNGVYSSYFTGGNHQYNNMGSGSTATGRTDTIRFFIDGRETTAGVGYAMNNIEIRWVNYVQGFNTTKSDGTGREILKEIHTLVFDGRVFNTHVEVIPLEDINMHAWYGFQCTRETLFNVSSRFIGGVNREKFTSNLSSVDGGAGKVHTMIHEGTKYGIKLTLDPLYDMGANDNRTTPYAFNSGNKAYFNLTDRDLGISMTANNSYYIRGSYEFFIL